MIRQDRITSRKGFCIWRKANRVTRKTKKNEKNAERITGLPGKTRTAKVIRTASKSEIKRWISRKIEDNL